MNRPEISEGWMRPAGGARRLSEKGYIGAMPCDRFWSLIGDGDLQCDFL